MKESHKVGLVLVFCFFVAWLDRMAINMAIPFIAQEMSLDSKQVGWVLSAFFLGYALFQVPGGLLADRFGPRRVVLAALSWWSVFTAVTGTMATLPSMLATRFLFGVGEGVFPACVWKVIAGWFTRKNRATANGLILSTIALGPALTPLVLAPVISAWGWRAAFYALGLMGIVCVLLASRYLSNSIEESTRVSPAELAEYRADEASRESNTEAALESASFAELLRTPVVWALFFNGLVATLAMYGWLNWLPSYLMKVKGLDLKGVAWAASIPFLFGTVGCMLAGWVSDRWFRGRRKWLVVGCLVIGMAALYAFTRVEDFTTFTIVQSIAGFFLFMSNGAIWTLPMVLLPARLMGSGSGFINTGGQIGGFVSNILIGYYIAYRGDDWSAGFDVMLGALGLSVLVVTFGIREQRAVAPSPAPSAR